RDSPRFGRRPTRRSSRSENDRTMSRNPESRATPSREEASASQPLASVHRRFGWTALFAWMTFGLVVELLHGIKLGGYLLDPLRREFWTLAHFHGALLAVVNLVYVRWAEDPALTSARRTLASRCLIAGSVLMPL